VQHVIGNLRDDQGQYIIVAFNLEANRPLTGYVNLERAIGRD